MERKRADDEGECATDEPAPEGWPDAVDVGGVDLDGGPFQRIQLDIQLALFTMR